MPHDLPASTQRATAARNGCLPVSLNEERKMRTSITSRRGFLAAGAGLVAAQALPFAASAQSDFPSRPMRLLVGFAPGGSLDNVARIIAAEMSVSLGQQVVVENKTGASGNIANQSLVAARADGYTMTLAAINLATNPPLMDVGYDPDKDVQMVAQLTDVPVASIANAGSPLNNLNDLIAAAKAKNGALRIGSGGIGTSTHLGAELLSRAIGFKYTHVPYRGDSPALQALFSGETDAMFGLFTPTLKSNMEAGKVKILGIMQQNASPLLPTVKSAGEQGIPAAAFIRSWQGIAVRGGTSPAIIDKLFASIVAAQRKPEVAAKFAQLGSDVHISASPAEFQAFYKAELARWTELIKVANIKAQ
jgi:tripartite-type tricarboxylate transporter receptor subunit TctC